MGVDTIKLLGEQGLKTAATARQAEIARPVFHLDAKNGDDPGQHYANYTNMVSNRILMLFDDCSTLLGLGRIPAACVLSRCLLETFAVGQFSQIEIVEAMNKHGLAKASKTVLDYVNSSRIKVEEQKRYKSKKLDAEKYHFSKEALQRMRNEEAQARHIMNALRSFYASEMEHTGENESVFEFIYDALSEWVHPSQTSLFHAFAKQTWEVETSAGPVSIWDGARMLCVQAMYCITTLPELREAMEHVAGQLTAAYKVECSLQDKA